LLQILTGNVFSQLLEGPWAAEGDQPKKTLT